jgi:N-terminal acetyltransferase B complex non-catalytic subunit
VDQGDPIALNDIRDLRFMASIFVRQKRCEELCRLWNEPPESLKSLFHRHHDDLVDIRIRGLREAGPWKLLENHCIATIEQTLSQLDLFNKDKPEAWELCARRWNIWEALLHAVEKGRPEDE